MNRSHLIFALLLVVLLAGCSKEKPEENALNPWQPSTVQTTPHAASSPIASPVNTNRQSIATKKDEESDLRQAAIDGEVGTIQRLLNKGVNIDAGDERGWTALRCAVFQENTKVVKFLLKHGADPNTVESEQGSTPLHWAAQVGNAEIAKTLLEAGAEPNVRDTFSGSTPLYFAATGGYPETAKVLLAKGADPNMPDKYGDPLLPQVYSAYRNALSRGKPAEASSLLKIMAMLRAAS
jgi:ankyrin repeat protein